MTAAQLSNLAMVTSVVLYVLAMLAHAAEWASSRAAATVVTRRVPVTVGAAAAASDAEADAADASPVSAAARLRAERTARMGVALMVVAAGVHLVSVVARGVAAHRMPWGNMYEFVTAASLMIVLAYLVLLWKWPVRWLGLGVALLAAVLNGLAVTVFYVPVAPLVPALRSVWFIIHIAAAILAGAAFNVGGLAAIAYVLKTRAEAKGQVGGLLARLPAPAVIDRLSYRVLAFSFPIWTFTIAAGAIWAQYAWGRYWGWDPKETWSLITWVVYAAYLHARATAGWTGRRAAWIAIAGLLLFWFNFVGINLLVAGLHSYAGIEEVPQSRQPTGTLGREGGVTAAVLEMTGWGTDDRSVAVDADRWLRRLYDEHWAAMVRLASLLLGSSDQADEIVQDAMVAVYRRRAMFGDTSPKAYLRTAVVNACRSAHRHRAVVTKYAQAPDASGPGPDERALQAETSDEVMAALRRLPTRQQEVLVLRYYSELSEAEIADALGISRGSVKSHSSRGMAALREQLHRRDGGDGR